MKSLIGSLIVVFASSSLIAQKSFRKIYETIVSDEPSQEKTNAVVNMAYAYLYDKRSGLNQYFSDDYLTEANIFEAAQIDEKAHSIIYFLDKKAFKRQVTIYIDVDIEGIYMLISKARIRVDLKKHNSNLAYQERIKYVFFSTLD